jgi:hypothetical protein
MFVIFGLLGCATTLPPPKPLDHQMGGIGISLKTRPPVKIVTQKPDRVYFVKLHEGTESSLIQSSVMASNYVKGDYIYLLNAPPGRYVAVAATRSQFVVSLGKTDYATYFPKELIKLTEVTVKPGSVVFMGEFIVDQSVGLKGCDDVQLHYYRLLAPGAENRIMFGDYHYRGSLYRAHQDKAAYDQYLIKAKEHLGDTGWAEFMYAETQYRPDRLTRLEYQLREGNLLSYNFRSMEKMEGKELCFEGKLIQMISKEKDTGEFSLQEMVNAKWVKGMEEVKKELESIPQFFREGVALSSRKIQANGSVSWEYQSFPWRLPFSLLGKPVLAFPNHPVRIGDSWQSGSEFVFGFNLTFVGFRDVLGYQCAEINVSIPVAPSVKFEGTLFFAIKEGILVKYVLEHQVESSFVKEMIQLAKLEQLSSEELQREKTAWDHLVEGEQYLRAGKAQKAKVALEKLLASSPQSRWEQGVKNWTSRLEKKLTLFKDLAFRLCSALMGG